MQQTPLSPSLRRPVRQCVIVCDETPAPDTPLPLQTAGNIGRDKHRLSLVDFLVEEATRQGFDTILILDRCPSSGNRGERSLSGTVAVPGANVSILPVPEARNRTEALIQGLPRLEETFLCLDPCAWFAFNWRHLAARLESRPEVPGLVAVPQEKRAPGTTRHIPERDGNSACVCVLRRRTLESLPLTPEPRTPPDVVSFLEPVPCSGSVLDARSVGTCTALHGPVPGRAIRPAVFLDRDGVLNVDHGYQYRTDTLDWIEGAIDAVRSLNDRGYYVFVVTNQAGIARGYYGEEEVRTLHRFMNDTLMRNGAFVDDWRYCPWHPEATLPAWRGQHPWRKPGPGMLLDLMEHWPVQTEGSFLVGDRETDLGAAQAAGLPGVLFQGGNLLEAIEHSGYLKAWPLCT